MRVKLVPGQLGPVTIPDQGVAAVKRFAVLALIALTATGCGRKQAEPVQPETPETLITQGPMATAADSPTLAAVRRRGVVRCGVNPGLAGFGARDGRGVWRGFDVDLCRALAAAVLGDSRKVQFVPVAAEDRFKALKAGRIDVLNRNTSWTLSRDAAEGVDFVRISYFDGQGFLARKSLNLQSAAELSGARICVQAGTTSELNLADYFKIRGIHMTPVPASSAVDARNRYQREECDALTADISSLASTRAVLDNPGAHVLLPDVISKEPMGPVVRQGDDGWTDIVRWTLNAMILAEELGLDSKTVKAARESSTNPEIRRLLGVDDKLGAGLGLKGDWAYQIISQVGSYGEVFDRNLGAASGLDLARGQNALWTAEKPGLMYSPPAR
ncbi:MAG: amino acid ABC transporter substrate-binding protein [Caulobacter sp.]|nr:amino acid ABC transporter substrate-binding protein [Caulobacter sp.]